MTKSLNDFSRQGYQDGAKGLRDNSEMVAKTWGHKAANAYARGFAKGDAAYMDDVAAGVIQPGRAV